MRYFVGIYNDNKVILNKSILGTNVDLFTWYVVVMNGSSVGLKINTNTCCVVNTLYVFFDISVHCN